MEYAIFQGNKYKTELVHISQIRHGDTILHIDGKVRTVHRSNITHDHFMGYALFGDTYNLGTLPVTRFITGTGINLLPINMD